MDAQSWWLQNLTARKDPKPATLFYSFAEARWYSIGADGTWTPMPTPSWDLRMWRAPDEQLINTDQASELEQWFAR